MIFTMVDEGPAPADAASDWSEGLRERKKRLTRSLISDTATAMFLERGFDDVRVAEVAEACGVSEKTVYNYFPTKESLLLDREPEMAAELWRALGPGSTARSPSTACSRCWRPSAPSSKSRGRPSHGCSWGDSPR